MAVAKKKPVKRIRKQPSPKGYSIPLHIEDFGYSDVVRGSGGGVSATSEFRVADNTAWVEIRCIGSGGGNPRYAKLRSAQEYARQVRARNPKMRVVKGIYEI